MLAPHSSAICTTRAVVVLHRCRGPCWGFGAAALPPPPPGSSMTSSCAPSGVGPAGPGPSAPPPPPAGSAGLPSLAQSGHGRH
eukprot:9005419-Lingulodinium_polyedra.AAC.1